MEGVDITQVSRALAFINNIYDAMLRRSRAPSRYKGYVSKCKKRAGGGRYGAIHSAFLAHKTRGGGTRD